MNDTATVVWYLFHGSLALLFVLGVTAIIERFVGDDW
jgi:hypothetical protein